MTIHTIPSLADFVGLVRKLSGDWSGPTHGDITLWFRGHSDASWELVPGEYRGHGFDSDEMFSEFELKARPLLRQPPQSDWEWYFLMQHHGMRTRLLDWTTGSLLGLYFALRENPGKNDAAVWILDPWALNKRSAGRLELFLHTDTHAKDYGPRRPSHVRLPTLPIAIVPPYNSTRITVQRGAFTVHGSRREGIENLRLKRLAKVVIQKDAAIMIKRDLRAAGVTEFTVFPEPDGLAREICAVHVEGC
jgi:hypothetical protein